MSQVSPLAFKLVMAPLVLGFRAAARLGFYGGVVRMFLGGAYPERVPAFEGYTPDAGDVFVATFVKSGTNWAMQIAQQIAWHGRAEFEHIHDLVPWPETRMPEVVDFDSLEARDASPTGLRVIKTHASLELVPYSPAAKYLVVLRDPKEVAVSAYHFMLALMGIKHLVPPRRWAEVILEPGSLCEAWADHAASAWATRERANQLVLTFGEMKAEPERSAERVADLLGVELDEQAMAAVLERSSFAYMKAHESQFRPPDIPLTGDRPAMIRRGRTGEADELLHAHELVEIDRVCREALEERGSDLPYAELFSLAEP